MAYRDNWGGKTGTGAIASDDIINLTRKQRLRELTLETVDVKNDPFFMKNHLGSYECKLCLTMHNNEGNYLAHTQGRRHQQNLAKRQAREEARHLNSSIHKTAAKQSGFANGKAATKPRIKIGRPGYKVTKQKDPYTSQLSILFQILYPEISESMQPRTRFMSAFEQRVEPIDKTNIHQKYQYFLVAAEPYESIAFKIPNKEIDRSENKFYTNWDREKKVFTIQLFFKKDEENVTATGVGSGGKKQASGKPDPFAAIMPMK